MAERKDKIVGKVFHSFDADGLSWQGQIEAPLENGYYLVQLFDWLMGLESSQKVVHLADMKGWNLYDDREYWKHEGERRMQYDARATETADEKAPEVLLRVP